MTKSSVSEIDVQKIVKLYIDRFKGEPDATRLIVNMLADNTTDLNILLHHIVKHEFDSMKMNSDKASVLEKLSATYGLSIKKVREIVDEE